MGEARKRKMLGLPPQNPKRNNLSVVERNEVVRQAVLGSLPVAVTALLTAMDASQVRKRRKGRN